MRRGRLTTRLQAHEQACPQQPLQPSSCRNQSRTVRCHKPHLQIKKIKELTKVIRNLEEYGLKSIISEIRLQNW